MPECTHQKSEVRFKEDAIGRMIYKRQCLTCGAPTSDNLRIADAAGLATGPWDDELRNRWYAKMDAEWQAKREAESIAADRDWFEEASEYYRSEKWKAKSRRVIQRDQICRACLIAPAVQAHHLNYWHWKNEPLFDLVGVCVSCHEKITAMDRENRKKARKY